MIIKRTLADYQVEDIRKLRENFPELRGYLDDEIARCFSWYCDQKPIFEGV